jgi:hypothetical protein
MRQRNLVKKKLSAKPIKPYTFGQYKKRQEMKARMEKARKGRSKKEE